MAVVDFDNAVLDVNTGENPLNHSDYMDLKHYFYNNNTEVSTPTISVISNTPTKVSILYSGTFTQSGTEFYIAYSTTNGTFKVSNISYSAGDTYSFVIDIEVSGNS